MANEAPKSLNETYKCILGVDRLDYTKGLVNRMLTIEKLLEKYPEHIEKVIYLQVKITAIFQSLKYSSMHYLQLNVSSSGCYQKTGAEGMVSH